MQGQRGGVGSLPETLNFDIGSSSSNASVDQQICWNSSKNRIPDYLLLQQSDGNITYMNSVGMEQPSLGRWFVGEPSSSGETGRDERKSEVGWTSETPCVEDSSRQEDRIYERSHSFPLDNVSLDPLFIQGSDSGSIPPNLNLNAGFKASGLENGGIPPTSGLDRFLSRSESGSFPFEGRDSRPESSSEGYRFSRKRKVFEGSSVGENSGAPSCLNSGSNLVLSAPPDQANQRLRLGVREVILNGLSHSSMAETMENSRIRFSSSNQPGGVHSQAPNPLLPVNFSPNLRSAPATDDPTTQNPPFVIRGPALPRSALSSRGSMSLNSSSVGDRHAMQHEDAASRSMARIIFENPQNGRGASGNLIIPGNGSTVAIPRENPLPPQYATRISDYIRRQLISSSNLDSGEVQPNNLSSSHSGPSTAQNILLTGSDNQGHHSFLPRAMPRIERRGEGSGSHRLISELRNVLGIMRRGENLRLEDVMILDQAVLFGVGEYHDRHQDMRLDVDNMSYEELLALEERIGNVSTGLSEDTILTRLKRHKASSPVLGSPLEAEPCCICQEEYIEGEDVGKLDCGHDYHTACVKQWLMLKNLCPICKTTALKP